MISDETKTGLDPSEDEALWTTEDLTFLVSEGNSLIEKSDTLVWNNNSIIFNPNQERLCPQSRGLEQRYRGMATNKTDVSRLRGISNFQAPKVVPVHLLIVSISQPAYLIQHGIHLGCESDTLQSELTLVLQASEARLYTFSPETKTALRKFRLGTSRAKDPQAVICKQQTP